MGKNLLVTFSAELFKGLGDVADISRTEGELLEHLDFTDFETTALRDLLTVSRMTTPNLAGSPGIPKTRT